MKMDKQEKARIMASYYRDQSMDAPFVLRANGNFEFLEGHEEPEDSLVESWRKDVDDRQDLLAQRRKVLELLVESDCKVNGSYPNSEADKERWRSEYRSLLRSIYKSKKIERFPAKPF